MPLSNQEQETIINFNKANDTAYVFTYEGTWQRHIEQLGYKPVSTNSFGGRNYEIPKKLISKPRRSRTGRPLSEEHKQKLQAGLQKSILRSKTTPG